MRPGPGLVVMALAFISGARRGSSSSISSATATPTAAATSAAAAAAAAATSAASTSAAAAAAANTAGGRKRGRSGGGVGGGGVATTLPSTGESSSSSFVRSSGSYLLPIFLPHHLDFALQFHPQLPPREYSQGRAHSESWASSRIADRLQQRRRRRESSSSRDIAGRAGGTGGSGADSGGLAATTGHSTESSEANNQEDDEERGLTVQFPSSQAYDEDQDIFALVAEDDLLSEESFDRLIKLNEDADEEDYNLQQQHLPQHKQQQQQPGAETEIDTEPESETETETETETDTEAEVEVERETEQQQQDESRLIDEGVLQHSDHSNSHSKEFAISYDNNNNKREASGHILDAQTAQLIGHKDNTVPAVASTESAGGGSITTSLPAPVDLKKSILGTATSLTRLNPWISACDLAQPGTGTDLQVSLTAYCTFPSLEFSIHRTDCLGTRICAVIIWDFCVPVSLENSLFTLRKFASSKS